MFGFRKFGSTCKTTGTEKAKWFNAYPRKERKGVSLPNLCSSFKLMFLFDFQLLPCETFQNWIDFLVRDKDIHCFLVKIQFLVFLKRYSFFSNNTSNSKNIYIIPHFYFSYVAIASITYHLYFLLPLFSQRGFIMGGERMRMFKYIFILQIIQIRYYKSLFFNKK